MKRNALFFSIKLAVSILLIGFLATKLDFAKSSEKLLSYEFKGAVFSALVLGVSIFNNVVRWRAVMMALNSTLSFWTTFRLLYIGTFFNQTLPSSVGGDAFRMYLGRKEGLSLRGAVNCVMLERVATLFGLILLVVITQPLLLARIDDHPATLVFPILAVLCVIGLGVLMLLDRLPKRSLKLKVIRGIAQLATDARKLFLSPRSAFFAVSLGVTGNILIAVAAFFMASSIGVDVSMLDCLVLIPPVILITTIPISIAGWGLRESAMVVVFGFVGVVQEDALALSLMFGVILALVSLPGGFIWLLSNYKRQDVEKKLS